MDAMEISASALTAERTRMNLISSNLANANSTRTAEGGPYKRKDAVFATVLDKAEKEMNAGVEVVDIIEDRSSPRLQYDPVHPDANPQGYVAYPNVNVVEEMADMIAATRAYEANLTAMKAGMSMQMKALEISK
ncbi:flagellar basal body rod protein FlgC [Geobacter hydrogenophilus]|uniref:Flagellar basal-body rod protein FlgC n=1 Tax=Geobacter hydrogenophilus TaxID=40983 RepID=A0A9W6G2W3_9BACT|nr:flagellar basal body rod protein FlgC [Geobacter hydrogenophilus]MBT0895287.1 flagellar basal body rod protein FlgC [Geobacter hydrogenophilus]GLI39516.1 flagellar basal-body rod protein FlgC [Geobacter hydrogenophilus]